MGMDLVRGRDVCFVSSIFWTECLELAVAFGWKPAGTLYAIADLPDEPADVRANELARRKANWGGWYTSNDWQRVTEIDALAFAAALYRAVSAIDRGLDLTPDQMGALIRMESEEINDSLEIVKRPVRPASVARIANFASKGEFEIG
jgi:hypothetical protein